MDEQTMIKKGEAARLLGFGNTAGYKYLDFLALHKVILPVFLPGIKTPRYMREEVLAIADREPAEIPEFKVNGDRVNGDKGTPSIFNAQPLLQNTK